jgi:hypothetical protein
MNPMNKANSRSVLFLTELIIAILIFALSMGICGGVFASAYMTATAGTDLNEAVFLSESAAEVFRARDSIADFANDIGGGVIDGGNVAVYYDKDWKPQSSSDGAKYTLLAISGVSEESGLEAAIIHVSRGTKPIFDLTVMKNSSLGRQQR